MEVVLRFLFDGPVDARPVLVLAHGAGTAMDSPSMAEITTLTAEQGLRIVRFEFPYMAARRTGSQRPPDREPVLLRTWLEVIAELGGGGALVIGGKSLGGRMASMVADDAGVRGLISLGYPFHPTGRPEQLRTAHLETLRTPALFLQGERDPMGSRAEVETYRLSPSIRLEWLPDGDHSFKPRRASGRTYQENLRAAVSAMVDFVAACG